MVACYAGPLPRCGAGTGRAGAEKSVKEGVLSVGKIRYSVEQAGGLAFGAEVWAVYPIGLGAGPFWPTTGLENGTQGTGCAPWFGCNLPLGLVRSGQSIQSPGETLTIKPPGRPTAKPSWSPEQRCSCSAAPHPLNQQTLARTRSAAPRNQARTGNLHRLCLYRISLAGFVSLLSSSPLFHRQDQVHLAVL